MEQTVKDLAHLVNKMQDNQAADRETDRETSNSLKQAPEANTAVVKNVANWRSKVEDLQECVKDLKIKVELIADCQEEVVNPAYKVFQNEHLDLTKPVLAI